MQSHQDWHGRTNPSAGHTGQGHQAAYATDQTRQGHPPANVYDSYYTREGRDSSRSRRDQRSPRRHSRDRSSHGRHRDSRRRSRERRHSRSPRRKERRHESDRDRGTPSSRGTDSQHSRSSTDQAPRPLLPPPPPTDNYIPPLLPPTANMPLQGRPLARRSRGKRRNNKGATTPKENQSGRGTKRKQTDKSEEAAKRPKTGEILPQDLAEWIQLCATVQHNKLVLLDCQNGLRDNKGIDALFTPLDTQLRPPFPDTAFRKHMREIKEQAKIDTIQALLHLLDRNMDTLQDMFPAARGAGPYEPRLEKGLTMAKASISRIHPEAAAATTTLVKQLAETLESNRISQHHASGLRATTHGLPPALDNTHQAPTSRASSQAGEEVGSTATSSDSGSTVSHQESIQQSSGRPERTESQAVSIPPPLLAVTASTSRIAPERTVFQPNKDKGEKEKTVHHPDGTGYQGPNKQPAATPSHKPVNKAALDLKEHLIHTKLPLPLMATTTGARAQITHGQFEEDKILSPSDTFKVISSLNNYDEQADQPARELLTKVLDYKKKAHNVREVGGPNDPVALEHNQPVKWQERTFSTARHAVEWEKCTLALGLSEEQIAVLFREQKTGGAAMRAVMPLMNSNKTAKAYWNKHRYATKVKWFTRKALTQGLTLGELLRDDYEGFISRTPPLAQRGIDIHAVLLWHVRHDLQRFAWYVDNEWDISGDPATALAGYPHKDDLVGREIVAHFTERARNNLIPSQIYTPSALAPDTDFDVSDSPAASPSHEDRLAPTSAKKAKQQGVRLRTEAQRDQLLGHSSHSDISDGEEEKEPSDQGHQPANGSELQSSTGKVTDSTAKTYREHIERRGMTSTSTTTTTTPKPTPKAKRQLSLPKPRTPEGGSVYDKNSKRRGELIDGILDPALLKSRPVGRVPYKEPSSTENTFSESSSDDTASKATTTPGQDHSQSSSQTEGSHTDSQITHSEAMALLDEQEGEGSPSPPLPTSTSTPTPRGPATQGQFSSSNEEALLKCLSDAERTEFPTETRPPPSRSEADKAEREIHHGSEGTEQATSRDRKEGQSHKANTPPQQPGPDKATAEATEQTSSKASTHKKDKKKKSKKSKKEKGPEHVKDKASAATEQTHGRLERTESTSKQTAEEPSPTKSTTFTELTDLDNLLSGNTGSDHGQDENALTFWSCLDLEPDGDAEPADDISVIEETPPDQLLGEEQEPPAKPSQTIPNISVEVKAIQPQWKRPVEYIPTPITSTATASATAAATSSTRQEESTESQSPTKGLVAVHYQPTTWDERRQIPLGLCDGTVNFILGDERVASLRTFYTPTGHTVLRAIKGVNALQLANHMHSQDMNFPHVQCAVILVPNSDLPQTRREEEDSAFVRSGRWGPPTRGMKQLIRAVFKAFPQATVTFLLPDVNPCTRASDGTELEDNAMATYREKFRKCLAEEEQASSTRRAVSTRATQLDPSHFDSEPPYSLNKKGANTIVTEIKSIILRHHFRTTTRLAQTDKTCQLAN